MGISSILDIKMKQNKVGKYEQQNNESPPQQCNASNNTELKKQLSKYFENIKQMFAKQKHIKEHKNTKFQPNQQHQPPHTKKTPMILSDIKQKQKHNFRRYADLSFQDVTQNSHNGYQQQQSQNVGDTSWKGIEGSNKVLKNNPEQEIKIVILKEKSKSMNFKKIQPNHGTIRKQSKAKHVQNSHVRSNDGIVRNHIIADFSYGEIGSQKQYQMGSSRISRSRPKRQRHKKWSSPQTTSSALFQHLKHSYNLHPSITKMQRIQTEQQKIQREQKREKMVYIFNDSLHRRKFHKNKYVLYQKNMLQQVSPSIAATNQIKKVLEEQSMSRKSRGTFGPWKLDKEEYVLL